MVRVRAHVGDVCLALLFVLSGCGYSLLQAASDGDTARVLSLLDQGMDVNLSSPIIRTHPLTLAASGGHVLTVCALLDRGAHVSATDLTGWTALHGAAYKGHSEVVRLLVERGAPTSRPTWILPAPRVWAERAGYQEVVAVLKDAEGNALARTILSEAGIEGLALDTRSSPCPPHGLGGSSPR